MDEIKKINTKNLTASDLPVPNAGWSQFCLFALSWDPSVELEDGQFPYSSEMLDQTPTEASTIPEIRWYLYLQQRWWNNQTEDIDEESLQKIYQVIETLRNKLQPK